MRKRSKEFNSVFFEPWHYYVFVPLSIITIWWGILIGYYDAAILDLIIKGVFVCVIIREYRHRSDAMAYMRVTTTRLLLVVSMPVMWQCINPYSENVYWALLAIGALALEVCLIIHFETGHWEKRLRDWTSRKKIDLKSGLFRMEIPFVALKPLYPNPTVFGWAVPIGIIAFALGRGIQWNSSFLPLRIIALANTIALGFPFGRLLAWTLNLHWHEKETGVRFKTEFSIAGTDEGACIGGGMRVPECRGFEEIKVRRW